MSDNLWNEATLLDRYQVFQYIYFIDIRPVFLNYLKKLYVLYKRDLRSDFISQSFSEENSETQDIERDLLKSPFFQRRISQMTQITFRNYQENPYRMDRFLLDENRRLHEKNKIEDYAILFAEITDYVFRYFLKMQISIPILDKLIRSLMIENPYNLHCLPCLVAANFQLILHQQCHS